MSSHEHGLMSVAFLECDAFREFIPVDHRCCKKCHADRKRLIYVHPWRDEVGNKDWFLCVEGIVCCSVYDFVRDIPHSWWEEQSKRLGVKREDGRGNIYPQTPALNTDGQPRPRVQAKKIGVTAAKRRAFLQRDEPSLDDFLKRRR